jgi:hypothetical protein
MRLHADRYDDRMMRIRSEQACGLPSGGESSKVSSGSHAVVLSEEIIADLDATWSQTLGAQFGLVDYPALLQELAAG